MRVLGKVLAANYHSFTFRSDERVPADVIVATPLGGRAFLVGRVGGVDASAPDRAVYEVEVLRRGEPEPGGGIEFFAPREPAVPGAEVYEPPREVAAALFGFGADPKRSLRVGTALGGAVEVLLRPESLWRHVFVCGTTGSGKSHFAGVLVEELARLGIPAVVVDPLAEHLGLVASLGGAVVRPGRDYEVPLSSLTPEEAAQVVAALEGTHGYDLFLFSFTALRREVEEGHKSSFGLGDVLRRMERDGIHALRLDGYDVRVAMARVEHSLKRHRFLGEAERGPDWAGALNSGLPLAVDCSSLDALQVQLLAGATLRELQRLRLAGRVPPLAVFLDEAHLLAPSDRETPCKQVVREYVRMGRHWGVGVVLVSQNPLDVDRRVLAQCNTRAVFALEPDQLEALQGVKSDATPAMLRGLPRFPRGTCLLTGSYETVRHAVVVSVREFLGRRALRGAAATARAAWKTA